MHQRQASVASQVVPSPLLLLSCQITTSSSSPVHDLVLPSTRSERSASDEQRTSLSPERQRSEDALPARDTIEFPEVTPRCPLMAVYRLVCIAFLLLLHLHQPVQRARAVASFSPLADKRGAWLPDGQEKNDTFRAVYCRSRLPCRCASCTAFLSEASVLGSALVSDCDQPHLVVPRSLDFCTRVDQSLCRQPFLFNQSPGRIIYCQ